MKNNILKSYRWFNLICWNPLFVFLATILIAFLSISSVKAGSFRRLGVKDGLSSRQVYQIEQDSAGFIWLYNHLGIDRFDGNEIKHYELDGMVESKNHILSSTIMTADRKGTIWVFLKDGKIYSYERKTDTFLLRINLKKYLDNPILNNIQFDQENNLWLCLSNGVYRWNVVDGLINCGLKDLNVTAIVQLDSEYFFAGTDEGLFRLNRTKNSMMEKRLDLPKSMHIESLFITHKKLFIGTFSDGVYTYDIAKECLSRLDCNVSNVPVRSIVESEDHQLYIGVDGAGLFCFDILSAKLVTHYLANEDDDTSLSGNTISDLCIDKDGRIWVSTSTNGISCLDPVLPDVDRIKHQLHNSNSLVSNHVNVILQDSDGDCWYGTNNGVSVYKKKNRQWVHYLTGTCHNQNIVLALAEDIRGNIWAGGYGMGVCSINKHTGKIDKLRKRESPNDSIGVATDYVYTIFVDHNMLWFGGIEGNLTCYDTTNNEFYYYPINCTGDIKRALDGSLLLAGCEGLAFIDSQTKESKWIHKFGDFNLHYPIRCLLQSSVGSIWMATDGEGLIEFDPKENTSKIYTTEDGLDSNSINSLLEDETGKIWFTTEKGLYSLDIVTGKIININDFMDISWGYYNPNAACKMYDGNFAFGTADGVVSFSPFQQFGHSIQAKLIFTDFQLLYESIKVSKEGSLLQSNIDNTKRVILGYDENSFTLSYSSVNLGNPRSVRYEYMLTDYDEQWMHMEKTGNVSYANLQPGTRMFVLRAYDKYSGKMLDERHLEIVVRQPFWLSWWAWVFYCILLLGFLYLLFQNRKHQMSENKIREKIRSFISIAHDIRTPITLIKAPLSELQSQKDLPNQCRETLEVAINNVERLLSMISQLIDLEKSETKSDCHLKIRQYDVEEYLNEKLAAYRLIAEQKGLNILLNVEPNMPKVWIDRYKIDHILDNLLSNALKYTNVGTIQILIKSLKDRWSIEIKDTGLGIPKEDQSRIFKAFFRARNVANSEDIGSGIGLMITKQMVIQHQGSISFLSEEGKGTSFLVALPFNFKNAIIEESVEKLSRVDTTDNVDTNFSDSDKRNVLLLAEDDEDMREFLLNSLSSEYRVIAVADGGSALEMAKDINPDIIISDVIMPVLEGDELCRILKSSVETSHIPIILLTALNERENIIFGLEAGTNDYIIKPFDLSVLKIRIRNILQNRQRVRDALLSMQPQPEEVDYTSQLDREFLDKVMNVVQSELSNTELSMNDFCRKLGMSRTSVYNKIKTLTGQGPNDYIRIVRLNKAKEILTSGKFAIGDVAIMVGFSDPKYFSTCFKKQFGVSPSKIGINKN